MAGQVPARVHTGTGEQHPGRGLRGEGTGQQPGHRLRPYAGPLGQPGVGVLVGGQPQPDRAVGGHLPLRRYGGRIRSAGLVEGDQDRPVEPAGTYVRAGQP
ncbi:hypothetical protein ABMX48_10205 [Streptomyces cavourensis]